MSGLSVEETKDVNYINKLITEACPVITKGTKHTSVHGCLVLSSYVFTLR